MNKKLEQTAITRQNIEEAYMRCVRERGFEKTSVSELMKVAGYNRGTFYAYYTDILDLQKTMENELIADISGRCEKLSEKLAKVSFDEVAREAAGFIRENADRLFLFLENDPTFSKMITEKFSEGLAEVFPQMNEHPYREYILQAYVASVIASLTMWHNNGEREPIDEIARTVHGIWVTGMKVLE